MRQSPRLTPPSLCRAFGFLGASLCLALSLARNRQQHLALTGRGFFGFRVCKSASQSAFVYALTGCPFYKSSLRQQHLIDDVDHTVICHDVGLNHMGIIHAHTMPTVDLDLVPFDR